ncbi:FAD-binding protein, partial [Myxococcota bacterium]|nr:FAD-binding protein [Myxococcota bacterium]
MKPLELSIHPDQDNDEGLRAAASLALGVEAARLRLRPTRRVIDARRGVVKIRYNLEAYIDAEPPAAPPSARLPTLSGAPRVIIIGAGPAGLYAAYKLIEAGVKPLILERGAPIRERRAAVAALNREGRLDPNSNYCFGAGGAGTFSDGKLYTRAVKRGRVEDLLALLIRCGAPPEIAFEARPHIGTNRLPGVILNWLALLEAGGAEIRFHSRAAALLRDARDPRRVRGVELADGQRIEAEAVLLAPGHSARDLYTQLEAEGVALEGRAFALGVRVEHPQPLIDRIQYGALAGHPRLGAAPYRLTRTEGGVGVFSFCMCPGGFIVAAATEPDGVVVNGMSPASRGSRFANSGMVVTVGPEVFGPGALDGVRWQRQIERAAFEAGRAQSDPLMGGLRAPAQRLTDFLKDRASATLPETSYRRGISSVDLRAVLPPGLSASLKDALRFFGAQRMRGYITEEAVLVGVESRTSAPVRITRDPQTLQSVSDPGLYPVGEGAGYAGGIVSAALD